MPSRREFLCTLAAAAAGSQLPGLEAAGALPFPASRLRDSLPNPSVRWRGESGCALGLRSGTLQLNRPEPPLPRLRLPRIEDLDAVASTLRGRFPDLRRRLVFEYYPWYANDPWFHWDQWDRKPPTDIAATSVPLLGAYDSRSTAVLEQHARWIAESGIGAINVSWWGPGTFEDRATPRLMDAMRDHDIRVTFHLEPYRTDRVMRYAEDVLYLLREYGQKRRWDAFLLLEDGRGGVAPVFKSFRTIVPPEGRDCHGNVFRIPDYVPHATWRQQTDRLRSELRHEFPGLTLLADVSDMGGLTEGGFDGMAIYDNFVRPTTWRTLADMCSARDLAFSFNTNPGFDGIHLREVEPDSCYVPSPIEPPGEYDWSDRRDLETVARASRTRIAESFHASVLNQGDPALANVRRRFFLMYVNSFNEWHEGHQFEPMKDRAALTAHERALGYRNPERGNYRLAQLTRLVDDLLSGADRGRRRLGGDRQPAAPPRQDVMTSLTSSPTV